MGHGTIKAMLGDDAKDTPYSDVAETLVEAFALSMSEEALTGMYHTLVEAVVHPYNADAIHEVRALVSTFRALRKRHDHGPSNPLMAQLNLDAEAAAEEFIKGQVAEAVAQDAPSTARPN
jgi:hypothetical protein